MNPLRVATGLAVLTGTLRSSSTFVIGSRPALSALRATSVTASSPLQRTGSSISGPVGVSFAGGAAAAVAVQLAARRGSLNRRCKATAVKAEGDPASDVSEIEFRVGEIVSAEKHPESEKLLVEQIDVGEEEPRQILSGIGAFFKPEEITGKRVVIVSNLKARKLAGMPSNGMLLCATISEGEGEERETKELTIVEAPAGAEVGERVEIEVEDFSIGDPAAPNRVQKKKLYEKVAPHLNTDEEGTVRFKESTFMTTGGPCTAALKKAVVS